MHTIHAIKVEKVTHRMLQEYRGRAGVSKSPAFSGLFEQESDQEWSTSRTKTKKILKVQSGNLQNSIQLQPIPVDSGRKRLRKVRDYEWLAITNGSGYARPL